MTKIEISTDAMDALAIDWLREMRAILLENIGRAVGSYERPDEQENLRDYYADLAAVERILKYIGGEEGLK